MTEDDTEKNSHRGDPLSDEVFETEEDETTGAESDEQGTEAHDGERAPLSRNLRVVAGVVVFLLILAALVVFTISTIGLIRGGESSKAAAVSCDPIDRIDIGGPADDFTVTIDETTGTSLSRTGDRESTREDPGKASYEGVDPKTGKEISGDIEYTAGQISWAASSTDSSYLQVSKCTNENGDVVSERKLQVFVIKDATATSEKSISITTEN